MKKNLILISLITIFGSVYAFMPLAFLPILGGTALLGKIPGGLAETLANANVTMALIQLFLIFAFIILAIWSYFKIFNWKKDKFIKNFLFQLNNLHIELLLDTVLNNETIGLLNNYMMTKWFFSKRVTKSTYKKIEDIFLALKQEQVSNDKKILLISAIKEIILLI